MLLGTRPTISFLRRRRSGPAPPPSSFDGLAGTLDPLVQQSSPSPPSPTSRSTRRQIRQDPPPPLLSCLPGDRSGGIHLHLRPPVPARRRIRQDPPPPPPTVPERRRIRRDPPPHPSPVPARRLDPPTPPIPVLAGHGSDKILHPSPPTPSWRRIRQDPPAAPSSTTASSSLPSPTSRPPLSPFLLHPLPANYLRRGLVHVHPRRLACSSANDGVQYDVRWHAVLRPSLACSATSVQCACPGVQCSSPWRAV
ncbi:hypothetical protein ACQJBY_027038 [Aegilops geniculata]